MEDKIIDGEILKLNYWEQLVDKFWQLAITKGIDIAVALLILIVGFYAIGKLAKLVYLGIENRTGDPALAVFSQRIARVALKVMLLLSVASQMGIETTSFIAALGAAGLAIGLALQGSLSNFAGGVLILVFKPFRVNDVIQSSNFTGRVTQIDILYTTLNTFDNKTVYLPNAQVANSSLVNLTQQLTRMVELNVGISYSDNIEKARQVILEVSRKNELVIKDNPAVVGVTTFGDNSVDLIVRMWVKTEDYWPAYWGLMEEIKVAFDKNGISIPFPQRDINVYHRNSPSDIASQDVI